MPVQASGGGAVVQEVKLLCAVVLVRSISGIVQQEETMAVVNLGTAVSVHDSARIKYKLMGFMVYF